MFHTTLILLPHFFSFKPPTSFSTIVHLLQLSSMAKNQQQQSPLQSIVDENHSVMIGILEITLNILVEELMVLNETIVYFKNLKDNGFDLTRTLEF